MTYAKKGDWNAICDRCGFKYKASQLKKEWDGFYVCKTCWEPRHPSDFYKPSHRDETVPWTRPEPADNYITSFCTTVGRQGVSGQGVAGCAIAGLDTDLITGMPSGTFDNTL